MIDSDGYRPNVGIIIMNSKGFLLWARRYGQNSWQFPQGGINAGESIEDAMFRELYEEVGLRQQDVKILSVSKSWLRYKLPKRMIRWESKPLCIGQKQRWFLLELVSSDSMINMIGNTKPEFDGYRWVTLWYPIRQVVSFKRDVYRRALKEFASIINSRQNLNENENFVSKVFSFDKKKTIGMQSKASSNKNILSPVDTTPMLNNQSQSSPGFNEKIEIPSSGISLNGSEVNLQEPVNDNKQPLKTNKKRKNRWPHRIAKSKKKRHTEHSE